MKLAKPLAQISVKRLVIMSSIFGVLSIYGFNCSMSGFNSNNTSSGNNYSNGDVVDPGVGLLTSEQILRSMSSLTGMSYDNTAFNTENKTSALYLSNPDNLINDTYRQRSPAFPVEQFIEKMTGPQLISVTNLAAAFCNKLVITEKAIPEDQAAQRRFFNNINFSMGVDQVSSDDLASAAANLGRAFYSRELTEVEATSVQTHLMGEFQSEMDRSSAAGSSELAIGLCTAMLSAMDVLVY